MEQRLLSASIQQFIREHQQDDERKLVLQTPQVEGVPMALIAQQISGRRKAKEKLPTYFSADGIVYPPAVNLEQCSSETTARIKSELLVDNISGAATVGLDLTGGFGVDSLFLSRIANTLHVTEPDAELLSIARHNHQQLKANNITYHNTAAEEFVNTPGVSFDFVFIDPSRRLSGNQKIVRLSDSVPDIISLQKVIFGKAKMLMVKSSPLMDIPLGISELHFVKKVFVLSVQNECKEVLFLCQAGFNTEPIVTAIDIKTTGEKRVFSFTFSEERECVVDFSDPESFLFEPNAAILKSGAFKILAKRFGLRKISPNTHLYTGNFLVENFPGRTFRILGEVKAERKSLLEFFPEGKANVSTRNYPMSPEELKKKGGLKDGGERFLIGFSGQKRKILVAAERVK